MLIHRFNHQNRLDHSPAKSCELHRSSSKPHDGVWKSHFEWNSITFLFQWSSEATAVSVWTPSISQPRLDFTRPRVSPSPGARQDGAVEPVCRKNQLTKTRNYRTPRRQPGVAAELWGLTWAQGGWKLQQLGVTWAIFNWLTKSYHLVN